MWNFNRVTAYGAVPGYRPITLGSAGNLVEKCSWRNRGAESVGFIWMGENWYDPENGQFLSFDAYGHAATPSGYSSQRIDYGTPDGLRMEHTCVPVI
jgi:hypothetical protein